MTAKVRGLVCILAAGMALFLIGAMAAGGRLRDPLLWAAVVALSIVAAALRGAGSRGEQETRAIARGRRRMIKEQIILDVNGERREYGSLAEVPEELRTMVADARRSGGGSSITINVNGEERTYRNLEEVPAEYRDIIEKMHQRRKG